MDQETIVLEVGNNRVKILRSPGLFLELLDTEMKYSSLVLENEYLWENRGGTTGWDGWVHLLRKPKHSPYWFPTGLLFKAFQIAKKFKFPSIQLIDKRIRVVGDVPDQPIESLDLRDYQEAAVSAAIATGRGVLEIPPRGGKSRCAVEIVRRLALPVVWMAPTNRIVEQTRDVLARHLGRDRVYHLVGSANWPAAAKTRIVICTAATAVALPSDFYNTRQALIVDEAHRMAAKTYRDIFDRCDHIYWRFGMTGTFFRSGNDDMAMHAILSNVVHSVSSVELVRQKFLVPVRTVFLPVRGRSGAMKGEIGFYGGHGKHGIHEHAYRNSLVAHVAAYLTGSDRTVLILVGTKKQGWILLHSIQELIPGLQGKLNEVELLTSDTHRGLQEHVIESFVNRGKVRVLIGTSLMGEGVDLPACDSLIYARGEKAEVSVRQNAYRVATAYPGKKPAVIVDFLDGHNRKLEKHSDLRMGIYQTEPTFTVDILSDAQEFPSWLRNLDTVASVEG